MADSPVIRPSVAAVEYRSGGDRRRTNIPVEHDRRVCERRQCDHFLTPDEVCERWKIDMRTLDKVEIQWFYIRPRVRRVKLAYIEEIERRLGFVSS